MNIFTTVGRICNDLELKQIGETCICELNLAIPDRKKEGGSWVEATIFTQLKVWGKIAENLVKYKGKGDQIAVTARLSMDKWQDKETGKDRTKLYLTAIGIDFVGSKSDGGNGSPQQAQPHQQSAPVAPNEPDDSDPPF